jgi:hypothetical protein
MFSVSEKKLSTMCSLGITRMFALSLPSHVPFHTAKGFTLSLAKQVLSGRMDEVIRTMERNIRLV